MKDWIEMVQFVAQDAILRYCFFAFLVFILYHTLFRKYVQKIIKDITTFGNKIDKIPEIETSMNKINDNMIKLNESNVLIVSVLNGMMYDELVREVLKAKKINGKTHNQDEKFKDKWAKYVGLGDGNGNGILDDWDNLPWITETEYYSKL